MFVVVVTTCVIVAVASLITYNCAKTKDNKIDRAQLYGEIKFHVAMWDMGILKSRANPAEIDI